MVAAAEIEALFDDEPRSLDSSLYSPLEKVAIWFAVGVFAAVSFGLIFANDLFWTDGLKPVVWDPIVKDAELLVMRAIHRKILLCIRPPSLLCVVVLQAVFKN